MPARNLAQYILISLKGIAMGVADVIPGVSGGTIAFISGIYEELIGTIHAIDLDFFKTCRTEGFYSAWKKYNLGFLFALFSGIAISILSLAKLITWLMSNHPILVWSFFFGLVVASILYVGKQIVKWRLSFILAMLLAAVIAFAITLARPIGTPDNNWFLFLAGFIAIIAMILPGISGAFILLLLGAYQSIINTLGDLGQGIATFNWPLFSEALIKILIFGAGAVVGLKLFSRVLNWMFENHKDLILAVLTGFMIGALNKIWPWKEVLEYRTSHDGTSVPFLEKSILPTEYSGDPQLLYALIFLILGFMSIFALERLAVQKKIE